MLELAEAVLDVTGSKSELVFEALPVDDPTQRCPDISLAAQIMGWKPEVALREGLERTADWFFFRQTWVCNHRPSEADQALSLAVSAGLGAERIGRFVQPTRGNLGVDRQLDSSAPRQCRPP